MKIKKEKEYVALFVVILALSLYLVFRTTDRTHYELPGLPEIETAEMTKIEIAKMDGSIVLSRGGDGWQIAPQGYPADSEEVKNLLDAIGELTLTALVSESQNYERYDLNEDKRIIVKAWVQGKVSREFAVGKTASSSRHTFVALKGDDRVYHARGNLRERFDQTVEGLREKTVLAFEQSEIRQVELTKGGESMVFIRKQVPVEVGASEETEEPGSSEPKTEILWETAGGEQGDESELKRLISTLSNLRCEKYIEDQKKGDFQDPIYSILLKGAQEYRLSIFSKTNEDAKDYPAISSENAYPFLLSDRQADNIMKDPGEMLAKPEKS